MHMTFTNKNKFFEYKVSLNTANNVFEAQLVTDASIFATGDSIEEAVYNLEKIV